VLPSSLPKTRHFITFGAFQILCVLILAISLCDQYAVESSGIHDVRTWKTSVGSDSARNVVDTWAHGTRTAVTF